jgi:hypothetical protein
METVIVENKKELILQISLIDIQSPPTEIINQRADGSKTRYTFNPELFAEAARKSIKHETLKSVANYDKHIKKLLTNIRKLPKGYFE